MKRIFLAILIHLLMLMNASAQWVQTNGPEGGYINCIAISGSNIFAGTLGAGVFLSTNNGSSWNAVNAGLTSLTVNSLATNGSTIYAGTNTGVFLSTNNGSSWTSINAGLNN
ncbi:MAG TPA: regulator, partial [Bacteroidia bacterium]|nr:regulator [Bacteroidia bacterium]